MNYVDNKFVNWSENIENNSVKIYYPTNDNDIISVINKALKKNKIIRVVGSTHSICPNICSSDEPNIILLSLKQYHLDNNEDIVINHEKMTVKINAGLTIGHLYDQLNKYSYFLETQPASSAFTIGGIINMPVHGGRLGASLVTDTIVELTLIDMFQQKITKTETDSDFDFYRLSLGLFGIITSVTFKIQKFNNITCNINTYKNIFKNDTIDRSIMDNFFTNMISKCLQPGDQAQYNHSFLDFHNNKLLTIDWNSTDQKPLIYIDTAESQSITKLPTDIIHQIFLSSYRNSSGYLKILGNLVRLGVKASILKNSIEDKDMLWVSQGTRVYFMSYFIPVHIEGNQLDLTQLYRSLEIVNQQITLSRKEKKLFNVDFPMDMRFVVSSNKSRASPIYQSSKKIVYMVIDLTTGPSNLELLLENVKPESQ